VGIQERREREREATRQAILRAALEIAAAEGWQAVTMRRVAERIEYSPSVIYKYFEDKEAILHTLLVQGFARLLALLRAVAGRVSEPQERLEQMALAYWRFVWSDPTLFQLMFNPGERLYEIEEAKAIFALVREAIAQWGRSQELLLTDLDACVDILWATLHGLISLAVAQVIYGGVERAQQLLIQAVRDLLRAWRSSVAR
jgi:AcrR family transcriptional regulator